MSSIPNEWPPLWFAEFRNTITPKEFSYAATYARIHFSTEEGRLRAEAILTLFSKTYERSSRLDSNGELGLIVYF